jgi:hypothetical protein
MAVNRLTICPPNRPPTVTLVGRPINSSTQCVAVRGLGSDSRYRFRSLAIADQSLCHLLFDNLDEEISTAEKAVRIQPGNVRARQRLVPFHRGYDSLTG